MGSEAAAFAVSVAFVRRRGRDADRGHRGRRAAPDEEDASCRPRSGAEPGRCRRLIQHHVAVPLEMRDTASIAGLEGCGRSPRRASDRRPRTNRRCSRSRSSCSAEEVVARDRSGIHILEREDMTNEDVVQGDEVVASRDAMVVPHQRVVEDGDPLADARRSVVLDRRPVVERSMPHVRCRGSSSARSR